MTAPYRKKLIEVAEYALRPSVWPALVADDQNPIGLALSVNNGTLTGRIAVVPPLFQKGPDFRFGRVDTDLGESHSRCEARP